MPAFFLVAADDPIGKATAGNIILTNVSPVVTQQLIDLLSEENVPLKSSGVLIESLQTVTISYELKLDSLVLPLDTALNGFRVSAITANCTSRGYPTVQVTVVKPTNGSFATVTAVYGAVTIAGGFGMVNLWGGVCAQPASSSLNIASTPTIVTDGVPGATLGQIATGGFALSAFRKTCTLEGYVEPTAEAGSKTTSSEGPIKTREGVTLYRKNWTAYLIDS